MDHDTTIRQIGPLNLAACGARNFVGDIDSLMFQVGSKKGLLEKLIIRVGMFDTYSVRYVAMKKSDYSVIAEEEIQMVYADRLGEIVRKMGDRA